jgi:hypothetical protein
LTGDTPWDRVCSLAALLDPGTSLEGMTGIACWRQPRYRLDMRYIEKIPAHWWFPLDIFDIRRRRLMRCQQGKLNMKQNQLSRWCPPGRMCIDLLSLNKCSVAFS